MLKFASLPQSDFKYSNYLKILLFFNRKIHFDLLFREFFRGKCLYFPFYFELQTALCAKLSAKKRIKLCCFKYICRGKKVVPGCKVRLYRNNPRRLFRKHEKFI